jgi:hypothetical protein
MEILKSILHDCKSWDKFILNRWHLHAPIAFVAGCFLFLVLKDTIHDTYIATEIAFKIFVPSFLGFLSLLTFEFWQKKGRLIGELEMFESNKDLWFSEFFLVLGILTTFLYCYV